MATHDDTASPSTPDDAKRTGLLDLLGNYSEHGGPRNSVDIWLEQIDAIFDAIADQVQGGNLLTFANLGKERIRLIERAVEAMEATRGHDRAEAGPPTAARRAPGDVASEFMKRDDIANKARDLANILGYLAAGEAHIIGVSELGEDAQSGRQRILESVHERASDLAGDLKAEASHVENR